MDFNRMSDQQLRRLDMRRCPYDRNHVMKSSTYQWHISRCQRRHSSTVPILICPFNADHRVAETHFAAHTIRCFDRHLSTTDSLDSVGDRSRDLTNSSDSDIMETNSEEKALTIVDNSDSCNGNVSEDNNNDDNWDMETSENTRVKALKVLERESLTAEEVSTDGFVSTETLSRLDKSERKKLYEMQKQKALSRRNDDKDCEGGFVHLNRSLKIVNPFHSLNTSEFARRLRRPSQKTITIDDAIETIAIVKKELRKPNSSPFPSKLRLPLVGNY